MKSLSTQYDELYCFLLHLVWNQNIFAQPECKARYWSPAEEQQDEMAEYCNLTRTCPLPAYMVDWTLLSK